MAIIGPLAIVEFLLLVVQLMFGGALNTATHDGSPFVFVPLVLGLICLWIAFWRGLAKGPAAVGLAVLSGFMTDHRSKSSSPSTVIAGQIIAETRGRAAPRPGKRDRARRGLAIVTAGSRSVAADPAVTFRGFLP